MELLQLPRPAVENGTKTIVVAVLPASLSRLVEYRLHGARGMEVVARTTQLETLVNQAAVLSPDVIVTNERLLGDAGSAVRLLKRFSPGTRIVLIDTDDAFGPGTRPCGADAYIRQEALVRRLVPAIERL